MEGVLEAVTADSGEGTGGKITKWQPGTIQGGASHSNTSRHSSVIQLINHNAEAPRQVRSHSRIFNILSLALRDPCVGSRAETW